MVVEGGSSYSLFERPPVSSKIVQAAREKIVIHLDIHAVSEQLNQVGNFIRIAYNGLAMHSSLQGKVTNLAIRVTKLGDESALTITEFQLASERVLRALESTYWYIYNDDEDVARDIFTSVSSVASDMARKAMELRGMYEQEVTNVQDILEATYNTKEYEESKRKNLTQMMSEFETRIKRSETTRQEGLAAFKNYESLFYEARKREYDAIDDQTDPWKKIANAFTSVFTDKQVYDFQAFKDAEETFRQEKFKYLDEMEKYRKIKDEALVELQEFTHRLQTSDDDTKLADITIDALQNTLGGLKLVAIVMLDAAKYWKSFQSHLNDMQKSGTILAVEFDSLMRKDITKRRQLWRSPPFKRKALELYSHWVALGSVCYESMKGLKQTQQILRDVIKENPTRKEALANIRKLAKDFEGEIVQARRLLESASQKQNQKDEL